MCLPGKKLPQGAKSDLTCYIKCDPNVGQPVQLAPRLNVQEVVSAGNSTQELAQISFVREVPEGNLYSEHTYHEYLLFDVK